MKREEVIRRLKSLRDAKIGDPLPDWFTPANQSALLLSELAGAALELIEGKT